MIETQTDRETKPNVRKKAKVGKKAKTVTHSAFSPFNYLIRSISHLINVLNGSVCSSVSMLEFNQSRSHRKQTQQKEETTNTFRRKMK